MRTYSLYLSTLTGQNLIQATIPSSTISFTGTITGTTLTITSALSASLPAGLFFAANNVVNWITTGSGTAVNSVYGVGVAATVSTATTFTSINPSTAVNGTTYTQIIVSSTPVGLTANFNVNINNNSYPISSIGYSSGGNGYYLLTGNVASNTATQSYVAYIPNTNSALKYAPTNKSNLAQVKWNINWREIFGSRKGECRVRAKLTSFSSNLITWSTNVGSVRASLSSISCNETNGFNLGSLRPQNDFATATSGTTYLDLDTLTSNGATIIIPNTNTDFTITILNSTEYLMSNVPEYQLWLYFDVDDENPLTLPDSSIPLPQIFNPR